MGKTFYTEHEIEDMVKSGVTRLEMNDNTVLTGLAYEKAQKLGMQLVQAGEQPPDAPVRPYVLKGPGPGSSKVDNEQYKAVLPEQTFAASTPMSVDINARIKNAVIAKLGTSVDPALLDTIIQRVLNQVKV
jgi:hypothetical protein